MDVPRVIAGGIVVCAIAGCGDRTPSAPVEDLPPRLARASERLERADYDVHPQVVEIGKATIPFLVVDGPQGPVLIAEDPFNTNMPSVLRDAAGPDGSDDIDLAAEYLICPNGYSISGRSSGEIGRVADLC